MRAGPLSQDAIIDRLNHYFVPVYVSDEDYNEHGAAPAAEKAELRRIFAEGYAAGRSVGTVHVYLLDSGGHLVASMHVAEAAQTDHLQKLLDDTIHQLGARAGDPLIPAHSMSNPPPAPPGSLVLHLVARGFRQGSWREFPSENWITLAPDEVVLLAPGRHLVSGTTWPLDPALSRKILQYFYPQTENNDLASNRIKEANLQATVVERGRGSTGIALEGNLVMGHSFYPGRPDNMEVKARFAGWLDLDDHRRVRSFELATDNATYGDEGFGAACAMYPIPLHPELEHSYVADHRNWRNP